MYVDKNTKLQAHLEPFGYLTNQKGEPHEFSVQKKVWGHEDLVKSVFESHLEARDGQLRIKDLSASIQTTDFRIRKFSEPLRADTVE